MSDDALVFLRAGLDAEMRKRRMAFSVGGVENGLAIEYFRVSWPHKSPARAKWNQNVDALSRNGDRYSIGTLQRQKTGTIILTARSR